MNDPIELIVAVFPDARQAGAALRVLQQLEREKKLAIFDAAALVKTASGGAQIQETQDVPAGRGALIGALAGALFGLVGGPGGVLVGAAAGAAAGGVAAKKIDLGFADDFLKNCQSALQPGHSALLMLIEARWAERAADTLAAQGGNILRNAVQKGLAEQISNL